MASLLRGFFGSGAKVAEAVVPAPAQPEASGQAGEDRLQVCIKKSVGSTAPRTVTRRHLWPDTSRRSIRSTPVSRHAALLAVLLSLVALQRPIMGPRGTKQLQQCAEYITRIFVYFLLLVLRR